MTNPYAMLFIGLPCLLITLAPFFLIAASNNLSKQRRAFWFFGGIVIFGILNWLFAIEGYRLLQFSAIGSVVLSIVFPILLPWAIYFVFRRFNNS